MNRKMGIWLKNMAAVCSFLLLCGLCIADFCGRIRANSSEQALEMRAGYVGTSWEEAGKGERGQPFPVVSGEGFVFLVRQEVSADALEKYELRVILDECLTAGNEAVTVTDRKGQDITDRFIVEEKGQQVIFRIREKESAIGGGVCFFRLPVLVKENIAGRHFQENSYTYRMPNGVYSFLKEEDGEERCISGDDVWIGGQTLARMDVEQQVQKDCVRGEIVDYSVRVRQLQKGVRAINVVVEDRDLPHGLSLLGAAVAGEAKGVKLELMGKRGWRLTCPELNYGETIVVAFQCKVDTDKKAGSLKNVITARADNFCNPFNLKQKTVKDSSSIWVREVSDSGASFLPDK